MKYLLRNWRFYFLIILLLTASLDLLWRIVDLGVFKRSFLLSQGNARSVRDITLNAHRGIIVDRNNEPLAISADVVSVCADPKILSISSEQLQQLAVILGLKPTTITRDILAHKTRDFVYLKRHLAPEIGEQVENLRIRGVFLQQEYQRYYPEGEVTVHPLGFTSVDDQGQEGLELAYDSWLRGISGKKRIVKDRLGNIVEDLGVISAPQPGHNLAISIDRRIQYIAYSELKHAIEQDQAESGSVVILSVKTGEVLASANYPACNPNDRSSLKVACYRNRVVTDLLEPGSTVKPFSIVNALESSKYTPKTLVDTNPGHLKVDKKHVIYDDKHINNGVLTVTGVLQKSSDIGVTKITLSLPPNSLLDVLHRVGFSQTTLSGFPGEAQGVLPQRVQWRPFVLATLSFGYGLSVTPLQLAQAYSILANRGILRPISFLRVDKTEVDGKRVIAQDVADKVLAMLEEVVEGGTGKRAQITGYKIGGKTGTAHLAIAHGYAADKYWSLFAGIAPLSNPQIVAVVVIKNPRGQYRGGLVAAPVFANIINRSLRTLNVAPDNLE